METMSCEQYLTNTAMNRLAWLGRGFSLLRTRHPGYLSAVGSWLLTEAQQAEANERVALGLYLNRLPRSRSCGQKRPVSRWKRRSLKVANRRSTDGRESRYREANVLEAARTESTKPWIPRSACMSPSPAARRAAFCMTWLVMDASAIRRGIKVGCDVHRL